MKSLRPRVYTKADAAADPTVEPDGFLKKIVKYIPTEIVAAYVALADALKPTAAVSPEPADYSWLWGVFWILLVLTLPYTWFFTQETGKPKPIFQTIVAPIAFTAWVFALGGPFTEIKAEIGQPAIGTVALVLVLLMIPLVERIFVPSPPNPAPPADQP